MFLLHTHLAQHIQIDNTLQPSFIRLRQTDNCQKNQHIYRRKRKLSGDKCVDFSSGISHFFRNPYERRLQMIVRLIYATPDGCGQRQPVTFSYSRFGSPGVALRQLHLIQGIWFLMIRDAVFLMGLQKVCMFQSVSFR